MILSNWLYADDKKAALLLSLLLWAFVVPSVLAEKRETPVTALVVNRVNIFSAEEASSNPAYRLINRLHRTTLQETIVRELDVQPGDKLDVNDVEELERRLRNLNLFASATVRMVADGESGSTLVVNTRDRLSIVAGADGSFVGGVGEVGITVGERNLQGLGDSVLLSLRRNTADELRGTLSYNDLHWLTADRTARYRIGTTEEGDFLQLQFAKPFKSGADLTAWSTRFESVEQEIDYYESGLSVAQIPEQRRFVSGNRTWRQVNSTGSRRHGLSFLLGNYSYDEVQGSQSADFEQPEDSARLSVRMMVGSETQVSHHKVTSLDTLRFLQDLRFGLSGELRFGGKLTRRETGTATLRPVLSGSFTGSRQLRPNIYGKAFANVTSEIIDRNVVTTTSAGLKYYHQFTRAVTLAARVDYSHADNRDVLPVQFTLGESNGLRGYANRLLSGNEMFRFNIEQRIDLQRRIAFLDVGLVGFADIGWVSPEEDPLRRSAGIGLRLGSTALLGRAVIRMDVAYPFDDDDAEPVYSAAVGQVFTF